jgi:hypothetical protein
VTSTRTSTFDSAVEGGDPKQSPSKEALDSYLVTLDPEDNPQCMSTLRDWAAVLVISSASLCVTSASFVVRISGTCPACNINNSIRLPYRSKVCSNISCITRSNNPCYQFVCHWGRCWSSPCWSCLRYMVRHQFHARELARDLVVSRVKYHISDFVYSLLRLHFPSCICSKHW